MTDKPSSEHQQPSGQDQHKVRVGNREMTLADARAAMNPALAHQIEQQHPRAGETPQLAQSMIDAYAQAHEQQHGQAWTGQREASTTESQRSKDAAQERSDQRQKDQRRQA